LRSGMEARGVVHRATRQFAQTIADRSGEDVLALWEKWGERLDVRCAGTALRCVAKAAASAAEIVSGRGGGDCTEVGTARLEQLVV